MAGHDKRRRPSLDDRGRHPGLGWINLRGIRQSAFVINLLTIAKLVPLALFIVVGVWFIDASRLTPSGAGFADPVSRRRRSC